MPTKKQLFDSWSADFKLNDFQNYEKEHNSEPLTEKNYQLENNNAPYTGEIMGTIIYDPINHELKIIPLEENPQSELEQKLN